MCLEDSVEWRSLSLESSRIVDASAVMPCASYTRYHYDETTGKETRCETPLRACNAITSTGAISTALAHPDVTRLLEHPDSPVSRGNTRNGVRFQMRIGQKSIEIGDSCEGAPPDCIPVPAGLENLRELLQQIDQALASDMAPCDSVDD